MQILIEEHQYEAALVDPILKGISNLRNVEGKVSVNYVGYFYNPALEDCVFILPKVLMEDVNGKELVFGKYKPEEIIDLEEQTLLETVEHDFIYELSVWIYRAIVVYNDSVKENGIVYRQQVQQMSKGRLRECNTFLDILLALQKFNRENQDFFFFVLRNIHSGFNKINWTKTISHSEAYVQNGCPVYLDPVNKKRKINFDEELLVIFFSILNYMKETYGFPVKINVNFPLITGEKFKNYMKGQGKVRMMQIKYKYFSDKALYLWELCHAFFDQSKKINVQTDDKEYLLVKNFNIVFEAIIDELVGEKIPEDNKRLRDLKEQPDGKMVDHIYRYKDLALTENDPDKTIYYIGDSKYYKRGHVVGENSVYKQFTYARNVIQWNIDLFNDKSAAAKLEQKDHYKLRDDVTEGYNIIPNFFISAQQNNLKMEDDIRLTDNGKKDYSSSQFENRLFDRDTFLISHYDVNFLFVIALYGRNNKSQKEQWKEKVRGMFREHIQTMLKEKYKFYAMTAKPTVIAEDYIKEHFQEVLGKIYTPFVNHPEYFSLALDQTDPEKDNDELLAKLRKAFVVAECGIGQDPEPVLDDAKEKAGVAGILNLDELVLVCRVKNEEQLNWCKSNKVYNIPFEKIANAGNLMSARYAILKPEGTQRCQGLYKIAEGQYTMLTKDQMMQGDGKRTSYPSTPHSSAYLLLNLNGRDDNAHRYADFPFNLNGVEPCIGTTSNPYYLVRLEDLLKI